MTDTRVAFPKPCDQAWDAMPDDGCHRRCDVCDQTIFDLEKLTVDEAEALLDSQPEVCVRAKIRVDGNVELAKGGRGESRVLKAALGAAATFAVAACATPSATSDALRFAVSGTVNAYDARGTFTLVGEGHRYEAKVKRGNRFRFANVEPGTYSLTIFDRCGNPFDLGEIKVSEENVDVGEVLHERACIIVGKMERAAKPSYG